MDMETKDDGRIYISSALESAITIAQVAELINSAPFQEEVIEDLYVVFTPEDLAGQFASNKAMANDHPKTHHVVDALRLLVDGGALFDYDIAFEHATLIVEVLVTR